MASKEAEEYQDELINALVESGVPLPTGGYYDSILNSDVKEVQDE